MMSYESDCYQIVIKIKVILKRLFLKAQSPLQKKKKEKKKRKKKKVRWDGGTKMIIQLFLSDLGYIHQYIPAYVSVQYTNYVRILIIDVESCPPEPLLSLMSIETTATES